ISPKFVPLVPVHEINVLEDSFDNLISPSVYEKYSKEDYYAIRLTDTKVIPDVINKLRNYYPKILELRRVGEIQELKAEENKARDLTDPMKLVSDFFTEVTGEKLTSNQQKWVENALKDVNKK
ncbi:exonuclease SbcCD subunit D, partial [Lactobacillus salivarius]|nr:exonuclease SbcCD subunit D [Ligilactobacillus salivarius]